MNGRDIGKGPGQKVTAAIDVAPEKEPSTGGGKGHGQHIPSLDRKVFYRAVFLAFYPSCASMALVAVLDPSSLNVVAMFMVMMCFLFTVSGGRTTIPVLPKAKKHGAKFVLKDYQVLLIEHGLTSLTINKSLILASPLYFLLMTVMSGIEGTGAGIALCLTIYLIFYLLASGLNCWAALSLLVYSLMFKSVSPIERLARFAALALSIYVFSVFIGGVGRLGIEEEFFVASFNNKQHLAHSLAPMVEKIAQFVAIYFVASIFHCLVAALLLYRFVLYAEKRGGCAFHDKVALYLDKNYHGKDYDERVIKSRKSTIKFFKFADKYKHAVAFLSVVYFVVMSF